MPESTWTIQRTEIRDIELAKEAVTALHGRTVINDSSLRDFLCDGRNYLIVAVAESRVLGSLVGYLLCQPHGAQSQFLLYEIDVHPESRRRGVGSDLVTAFTNEAKKAGAGEIWVLSNDSNVAAVSLYLKCGFRRRNVDDVMLSLELDVASL